MPGRRRRSLEGIDVHPRRPLGAQHERLILRCEVAMARVCIEDPTGGVQGAAQVVGRRLLPQVGPEEVHHLLAVEAVPWRESKQLHYGRGLA
jgi:hypothetical protein